MSAPFCPISRSQPPPGSRAGMEGTATLLPEIPIATDLPSMIRAVNIMRDILRTLTTSLTVNNTWLPRGPKPPRLPKIPGDKNYIMSSYPAWQQVSFEAREGMVYYKGKDGPDKEQGKVKVSRLDAVEFRNASQADDQSFYWRYRKSMDSDNDEEGGGGDGPPFIEDFFERIINVKWTEGLPAEIYPGLAGAGPGSGGGGGGSGRP
jgi:hypothetical protein